MAGNILGMDVQAARDMARTFTSNADTITQVTQTLTNQLQAVTWLGRDGDQFRSNWQSTHVPNLTRICDELRAASQTMGQQADQQEQASSA